MGRLDLDSRRIHTQPLRQGVPCNLHISDRVGIFQLFPKLDAIDWHIIFDDLRLCLGGGVIQGLRPYRQR